MATHYNPPHEVRDEAKLESLVAAIKRGDVLSPVIVCGGNAMTGSHRLAAYDKANRLAEGALGEGWERAKLELQTVEIDDDEYLAACAYLGVDGAAEDVDYGDFCDALYDITDRHDLRAALADQRG